MSYAVEQRLRLIDFLLIHYGTLNRDALMDYFGISRQQAAHDIRDYLQLAPKNMRYDTSMRTYRRSEAFQRVFA
jgi:hypothetical protein